MSERPLQEFHQKLDMAAERYKCVNRLPALHEKPFVAEFCQISRDMEFELLDHIVSHIKSQNEMDEVKQKFILSLLNGNLQVSDDRFDNLVQIAQVTNL